MAATSLRATVALVTLAAVSACEVCHLHYFHKDVASKTTMTTSSYCKEYKDEACCTAEVAAGVGDAQQGYLYPDHNPATGCGKLSSTCEAFFIEEGCFYECDHNLGKWRKHDDCDDESAAGTDWAENGWQIEGMPIKASYCDAWFEACKGPDNKLCMGVNSTVGKPQYGYFDQPTCHTDQGQGGCKRIDEVYSSGFHMCETLWQGSFKYETNANADAYVMTFTEDDVNPNNAKFTAKTYPDACPGKLGAINFTQAALEGCDAIPISYLKSYLGTSTSGASSSLRTSGSVFGTAAALVVAVSLLA